MEIKDILLFPYTFEQRLKFVVENNHKKGYEIKEENNNLVAYGESVLEKEQREKEEEIKRIKMLKLTRGDVFRGLLQAKGITRAMLRAKIEEMPETTPEQAVAKELALIDFDEALDFYRGNSLVDVIGEQLNITSEQLTQFFETNDYTKLIG